MNRRSALAFAGAALAEIGLIRGASATGSSCRREGHSCNGNQRCCSGTTCEYSGNGNNKVCVAVEPEPECPVCPVCPEDTTTVIQCFAQQFELEYLACYRQQTKQNCSKLPNPVRRRQCQRNKRRGIQKCQPLALSLAQEACQVVITE